VLPVFKLIIGHQEGAAVDVAYPYIIIIQQQLAAGKAHGSRAVATAATLVEQERAVLFPQLINDVPGFGRDQYTLYHFL
jgi:hypothetical protein